MKAGTPGKYHINPSPKLMSRASQWRVVEHDDGIETIFYKGAFDDVTIYIKGYYNQAVGDCENKDDDYSYIVNTDYLNHREAKAEKKDGNPVFYFPKIKSEDNNKKN
ncbi:hypothetical protein MKW98_016948 [Papaver atlanticum]|uniref:Uncharacterized protein n=1 Tax=Papaver atlanticum TaxID=357466 RepID=A0AAD4TGW9_9MAGN|nr:hypothetical protein MKW98_016948 [Papaver atlanticum]